MVECHLFVSNWQLSSHVDQIISVCVCFFNTICVPKFSCVCSLFNYCHVYFMVLSISEKISSSAFFLTFLLSCRALATDLHLHIIMINIYSILFVTAYKEVCFLFPFFLSFCKIEWIALRQPMFEFRLLNLQVLLFVIFLISLNLLTFNKVCLMCIVKLKFLQSFKLNNFLLLIVRSFETIP